MNNLKILPLNIKLDLDEVKQNPILPSIPGISLFCAPPRSGKTVLCTNLLIRKCMWGSIFEPENIFIFSPSINNDKGSKYLKENFNCLDEYSDKALQQILDRQMKFINEDQKAPLILILFDDCMGILKKSNLINRLCSNYRHYNIGQIIFSLQSYKGIPNQIRFNLTSLFLLAPNTNAKSLRMIDEEIDAFGGFTNFMKLFNEATNNQERYKFMYVKLDYSPVQIWNCFDKRIQ
tara:strand:- start:16 stop:717 length:702 start_codon:yes stop_codon:yes gene_type:complete